MMTEVRTTRGEGEERIVDILVCPESLRDQQQDSVGTEESSKSLGTGRSQRLDAVSPTKCSDLGSDDLVVVDSKEEMDFISRWYNGYFWLGATDAAGEGTWRWVDGTVLSRDNPSWSRGGPDG
ncbi:unnamed protein product, partial [Gadus morhua 'NCC']